MGDDIVQLPPNSTGPKMRTINQVVGANTTEAEVMHIASPTNASGIAEVGPVNADALGGTPSLGVAPYNLVFNTSGGVVSGVWDRMRSAPSASGTTGTGLLGAGLMALDTNGNFQVLKTERSGDAPLRVGVWQGGNVATVANMNGDAFGPTNTALFTLGIPLLYNGIGGLNSLDRMRSVDAISGGTQSGIGILATQMVAYDKSGAAYRPVSTIASGSSTIKVGNVWSYTTQINQQSGISNITSGYTFLHSILIGSSISGFGFNTSDTISGVISNPRSIFELEANHGHVGLFQAILDVELYSGLNVNYFGVTTDRWSTTFLYRQAPLN